MKRKKKAVYHTKRPKDIPNHGRDEEEEGSVSHKKTKNKTKDILNHWRDEEEEEGSVLHEKTEEYSQPRGG